MYHLSVLSEKVAGYTQNECHIVLMRQVEQQAKFSSGFEA
jgi:hypothetical protein